MTLKAQTARGVEWPTVGLIFALHASFLTLTWFWTAIPIWLAVPLAAYLAGLYGSLQHEVIHGHPTRWRRLNEALVWPALLIWIPYGRYRSLHIEHHATDELTDPYDDPESFYLDPDVWGRLRRPMKALYGFNNTLAGRLTVGPAISAVRFWICDARRLAAGERDVMYAWAWHVPALAAVFAWTWGVCGIAPWIYFLVFAYAGTALILLRSFAEHRAHNNRFARTAIVETCPAIGLLFLNNNLHVVHHDRPELAWYEIPAAYRRGRREVLDSNDNYLIDGYSKLFRRYFFKPKEPVPHPLAGSHISNTSQQAVR